MEAIKAWAHDIISYMASIFGTISPTDIIDIFLLSVLLYYFYKFIRDRRAGKLAIGILFLAAFLIISNMLNMHAMQFILKNFFQVGIIAVIVVFQPEMRTALEKVGGQSLRGLKSIGEHKDAAKTAKAIADICEAVCNGEQKGGEQNG